LNNAGEDPSGAANASRLASPPAPGTNSAGTAQPSGSVNTGSGVTTGSARSAASGTSMTGPQKSGEAAITEENKEVDRKIKSICRGC
jgi:subtilisin family serine protease